MVVSASIVFFLQFLLLPAEVEDQYNYGQYHECPCDGADDGDDLGDGVRGGGVVVGIAAVVVGVGVGGVVLGATAVVVAALACAAEGSTTGCHRTIIIQFIRKIEFYQGVKNVIAVFQ